KSAPAKDDTLAAPPKSLDLWFSEPVDLSLLRVTLAGPGAANIALGKAAQAGTGKDAHVTVPVAGVMGAGAYAVTWVVAGADGHPTRGSFAFRLKSGR
ncbi:MAG: copper resistance protein CopC, partial [Gemmatimonadota bacterium]|nr:copper resistance protein CopC [Gemmatimonadota bacterium]